MKRKIAALAAVAIVGSATLVGPRVCGRRGSFPAAIPRPSSVPRSWELDCHFEPLSAIRVKLGRGGTEYTFWYVRYTVINRTGDDQTFWPEFLLYTDTGQLMPAGRGVPRQVYEAIKKVHNEPLLRPPVGMTGKLLQGEDNGKHGVAIWPDFDPKSGQAEIFVGGLSGEAVEIELPRPVRKVLRTKEGKETVIVKTKVVLSKTFQMTYKLKGDAASRWRTAPTLVDTKWVMR